MLWEELELRLCSVHSYDDYSSFCSQPGVCACMQSQPMRYTADLKGIRIFISALQKYQYYSIYSSASEGLTKHTRDGVLIS